MDTTTAAPASPERKRRRPALACEQCRKRKVKCDRTLPCKNCIRTHRAAQCSYQPDERVTLPRRARPLGHLLRASRSSSIEHEHDAAVVDALWALGGSSAAAQTTRDQARPVSGRWSTGRALSPRSSVTQSKVSDISGLLERVRQLEEQVTHLGGQREGAGSTPGGASVKGSDGGSLAGEGFTQGSLAIPLGRKSTVSKTRYFGMSHWSSGTSLFPMLYNLVLKQEQNPSLVGVFQACKEVGRKIKAARDPTAPLPLGNPIPISRQVADSLVGAYLRTFETVHRILHIPTFMSDYARYWQNPRSASPVFTTQLQLVLAIGACFHDDRFEMRGLASRWVHAAQRWLITPPEKGKMNIPGLQIMCLVHLAREVCALGADLLWISAGSLLRTAMYMGFHRDPKNLPGISPFLGEMRRRLWITVLELSLQSSLDSGGSPLISAEDWDTIPPGNYDDEQLTEMMGHQTDSGTAVGLQLPQPKAMTTYTQTSCAIALHKSFPVRLAIATIVNDFRTELSYHKTLQLNTELSAACRNLTTILSSYGPSHGDGRSRPSAFQIRILEQMTQRFFLVLNQVWLRDAQSDARYYFSRKVMVETALRLMRRLDYDSPDSDHEHGQQQTQSQGLTDFRRLTICGAGGFRSVFVACMASLGVELLGQLEDDRSVRTSLGSYPSPSSTSASTPSVHLSSGTPTTATTTSLNIPSIASQETIMAALRPLSKWTERRIRAGETNIKGYVFLDCITAQAEGLMRGESDDVIERGLLGVARERVEFALTVLEEVVAAGRPRWEGELEALQMKEQGVRVVGCTPLSMEDGAGTAFGDGMGVNQNQLGEMPLGQGEWGWEDLMQDQVDTGFNFGMLGMFDDF